MKMDPKIQKSLDLAMKVNKKSGDTVKKDGGKIPRSAPRVNESEALSTLIHLAIDNESPILVEEAGKDVGVITRADILRTVIEGTEVS